MGLLVVGSANLRCIMGFLWDMATKEGKKVSIHSVCTLMESLQSQNRFFMKGTEGAANFRLWLKSIPTMGISFYIYKCTLQVTFKCLAEGLEELLSCLWQLSELIKPASLFCEMKAELTICSILWMLDWMQISGTDPNSGPESESLALLWLSRLQITLLIT